MARRRQGSEALRQLGVDLRRAGRQDLRRELFKAAQRATRPVREEVAESARRTLPSGGGLNDWVADMKVKTVIKAGGANVGVKVRGTKDNKRDTAGRARQRKSVRIAKAHGGKVARGRFGGSADLYSINRGRLRHPVYGNRSVWVSQRVTPGFWTKVMTGEIALRTSKELYKAMAAIRDQLAKG